MLPQRAPARSSNIVVKQQGVENVHVKTDNIKVVVRLRPPNEKEVHSGKVNLIKVIDNHMLTFDPKEDDCKQRSCSGSVSDKKCKDLHFAFDRVFGADSTNDNLFECTTKTAIDSVLKGYNCSVFAYGATSAGKTHTMLGSPDSPGVIFLTMMELYKQLMLKKDEFESDISVSYLEIYNENCKDLLLPTGPLAVREDPGKGVCVAGLSLHKPQSAEELLEMLHYGNQNRTQHPTDANKQSSRSHAVFQVFVCQSRKCTGLKTDSTLAKMSLIDLAGSERATVTTNQGDRLREGANINRSLLALGNCINALAENKSKIHIPYRDSKLTRLLKDSLGGNCATIMIAAVSPSVLSYEDTYNTLKYADRAKNIKASLSANTMNVDHHITEYAKIVDDLKSQIADLKLQIQGDESCVENRSAKEQGIRFKDTDEMFQKLQEYEKQIHVLYKERCSIKQQLVDSETNVQEVSCKLLQRERNFKRLEHISEIAGSVPQHAQEKLDKYRASTELKQAYFNKQKVLHTSSLEENSVKLTNLQNEIDDWANKTDSFIRMHLNMLYEMKQLELKYVCLKAQCKYMRKQFPLQEADSRKNEQLVAQLLQIIATQQRKLNIQMNMDVNQSGLEELLCNVGELPNNLINATKIAWADQTCTVDNTSTYFDASPFKTPSKKPYVLRKIISESRKTNDVTPQQTHRNTLLNARNVSQTPLTGGLCLPDDETSTSAMKAEPLLINATFTLEADTDHNYSIIQKPNVKEDNDNSLTSIPVRSPLKCNTNIPKKISHRRSLSDGHQLFQLGKSKAKGFKAGPGFSRLLAPHKLSKLSNSSLKTTSIANKSMPRFAPVRAVSVSNIAVQKENVQPRCKTAGNSKQLKKFKSLSTLPVYKREALRF